MAKNIIQGQLGVPVCMIRVQCTLPASPVSGDPVLFGNVPGVAENTMDATTSLTTMNISCIAELNVSGVDGSGNSAVAAGDKLYYVTGDTIKISKKTTGIFFGTAFGSKLSAGGTDVKTGTLVASGAAGVIRVLVGRGGGS